MIARPRRQRGGFTLFEIAIVVAGTSILIAVCGSLIHMMLRLDRSGVDSLNDATTLTRLSRQFRQDVRASASARPHDDPADALDLTRPDGPSVSYRVAGTRLVREEREGDKVVRREAYSAGRLGPVRFETDGRFVRLILTRRPSNPRVPARAAVAVEAWLGKDRADLGREKESGR